MSRSILKNKKQTIFIGLISMMIIFSNNPVSIEVVLEFMGVLSIPEMQQLVAAIIFEETPRFRHDNVVGHLIGDLLVYYADLMIYTDSTIFGECFSLI